MSALPGISWSWGEGRYFDYWAIAHLVGGVPFGLLALCLGLGRWSYLPAAAIFVAWEFFEAATHTPEHLANRAIDVLLALLGFAVAYELLGDRDVRWSAVAAAFAVSMALNLAGWLLRQRLSA